MKDDDVAIRCNVVTISEEDTEFENRTIIDHSSDEISTEEAAVLIDVVKKELASDGYSFYAGVSYRHCLIWEKGQVEGGPAWRQGCLRILLLDQGQEPAENQRCWAFRAPSSSPGFPSECSEEAGSTASRC